MREKIKSIIIVTLLFIWMLSGSLIDSRNGILFFSVNMFSMGTLLVIAYLDGYMY